MDNTITHKKGALAYQFQGQDGRNRDRTLYVNLVPQFECPNDCRFCGRKDAIAGLPNIYEKNMVGEGSLYLPDPPTTADILAELGTKIKKPNWLGFGGTKEVAIVGLGEPLTQFDLVLGAVREIKREFGLRVRMDTDGREDIVPPIWFGCAAEKTDVAGELKRAGLDEIRISVNATSHAQYEEICLPKSAAVNVLVPDGMPGIIKAVEYFFHPFTHVCQLVRDCIRAGIKTRVSFVTGYSDSEVKCPGRKECLEFAREKFGLKKRDVIFREYAPPLVRASEDRCI
jgi:MoaA/NifB/PqqE/SkfB family radical SAM enzyme